MPRSPELSRLEQLVLVAILNLRSEAYGVPIRNEVSAQGGREASFSSVYAVLDRLERDGLVDSRLGAPTPERGGRAKRYYHVLATGQRALNGAIVQSRALWPKQLAGALA